MTSFKDSSKCGENVQYGNTLPTVVSQIADCKFQLFSVCIQRCQCVHWNKLRAYAQSHICGGLSRNGL
jgi:hypothetical protein